MKFNTIKIFHDKATQEKQKNHDIHQFPTKKEMKFMSPLQLSNNPDHGHEVKLPIQISHLSTKVQVFRKSQHLSLSRYFLLFLTSLYHEINS